MSTVLVRNFSVDIRHYLMPWLLFAGRTGRAGKLGTAITFLTNDDDEVMCVRLLVVNII
jgi:superfamily II DNA/RNA helicase